MSLCLVTKNEEHYISIERTKSCPDLNNL